MTSRGAHRVRIAPAIRIAAVAALVLISTGCARVFGSYDIAPSGLSAGEDRLRRMMSSGQAATALQRIERDGPGDDVLHVLYEGVLAYHAGEFARSARMLDAAGYMADDRITKSVSRAALSVVSNDLILPYEPGPTERLMIPYYAALARTQLGDREGAAVEARRLSLLLQQHRDGRRRTDSQLATTLHLIAAAMFEANGEWGEADVAYRNAFALDSTVMRSPRTDSTASVFVIVENGFVAHRVEQALAVLLLPEEVYAIAHGPSDDRVAASGFVAARVLEHAAVMAVHGPAATYGGVVHGADMQGDAVHARNARLGTLYVPAPEQSLLPKTYTRTVCRPVVEPQGAPVSADSGQVRPVRASTRVPQECTQEEERIDELPYLLKVAWPVFTADRGGTRSVRLVGDSAAIGTAAGAAGVLAGASVSRGVVADFEAERLLIVARTIARGAAKLALTKGAEKKIEEKNELAGRLVGLIGNVGNVLLERADTRSWHLLPASVNVLRVDLPPGEHALSVEAGGRTVPVTVRAQPGSTVIVPVRAW